MRITELFGKTCAKTRGIPPTLLPPGVLRGKESGGEWTGWPISRVLYLRSVTGPEAAIIHLGTPLPAPSSGLPGHIGRAALKRVLYGLAPGGVYLADPVTRIAGGLLHHLFTLTAGKLFPLRRMLFGGGFFSVALACGFPRVGVTHHPALWSPDFPRWFFRKRIQRDRLANPSSLNATALAQLRGFEAVGRGAARTSRRINWC
jgi:hypothetical protein